MNIEFTSRVTVSDSYRNRDFTATGYTIPNCLVDITKQISRTFGKEVARMYVKSRKGYLSAY